MSETYRHLKVRPEAHDFGAQVEGVALHEPLATPVCDELNHAWARYGVLRFPGQSLSLDDLERVTRIFGPFGEDPFVQPLRDHPHVIEVRREADEKSIVFGGAWHSDWSFQATPPSATLLYAEVIPPVGGNTRYADAARAYDELSDEARARVEGLRAIHSASAAYGTDGALAKDPNASSMSILTGEEAHGTRLHPLVRTHPVTGRRSLFVNPVYTRGIEGMSDADANELLAGLYAHMLQDEFILDHAWSEGMLTIWDNRRTMHLATGGYEGHRRLLYRTTVAGEVPV